MLNELFGKFDQIAKVSHHLTFPYAIITSNTEALEIGTVMTEGFQLKLKLAKKSELGSCKTKHSLTMS